MNVQTNTDFYLGGGTGKANLLIVLSVHNVTSLLHYY